MTNPLAHLRIISAGAGSGKTYRLTSEMVELLKSDVRPSGVIATTFTKKAAAELQERVRVRLLEEKMPEAADELENALIGTVHGLGVRLLHRFAFEAGVSPQVTIMADEDRSVLFNQSLATVLTEQRVRDMEQLCDKLGLHKRNQHDWRSDVQRLCEVARSNGFDSNRLEESRQQSVTSFKEFLGTPSSLDEKAWNQRLAAELEQAIRNLDENEDSTKVTSTSLATLRQFRRDLDIRGYLFWHQWAKISKLKVGAKSRDDVANLIEFAASHIEHPTFHQDIKDFIDLLFRISQAALDEYATYKNSRGLIDYTDMEVLVNDLLDQQALCDLLQSELDLLMVDEFQDTSPIQLEIFLKLSRMARYSVWVGDPKQSIYGFRGAEPRLMEAIIQKVGGIRAEDIQRYSWRSREELVWTVNAIFTKAFPQWPEDQVALIPKRCAKAGPDSANRKDEPTEVGLALMHWHFDHDTESRRPPGSPWMENALAEALRQNLERGITIKPKGEKEARRALPGDVAILCRANYQCLAVAEALHRAGLKAAIARAGLLQTSEAKLILACLKFILNRYDTLSVAEILLLAEGMPLDTIVEDRLEYLESLERDYEDYRWAEEKPLVKKLHELRPKTAELSSAETLTLILEELDLRRLISAWGNEDQRLANVAVFSRLASDYEEGCNRLHTAASLGGFLLWLNELERQEVDWQASGEGPGSVNVLTYHRSKGLEWPVVICHSLEQKLRGDIWGLSIVSEQEEIDLDNVLGHRWIRYWVNPYADQQKQTVLWERLQESEAQLEATKDALQEEVRLLYVGMTRARDYLILPTRKSSPVWLNRICNEGKEDVKTLDEHSNETIWNWKDHFIDKVTETFLFPVDFPYHPIPDEPIRFLGPRAGRTQHNTFKIDLYKEEIPSTENPNIRFQDYSTEPVWPVGVDAYRAAKAVKSFFIADHADYPLEQRRTSLTDLLNRVELEEDLDVEVLLEQSASFQSWLQTHEYKAATRKHPLQMTRDNRLFDTVLDWLLETEDGLVVIQNSGFTGDRKNHPKKMRELASWANMVRSTLQASTGQEKIAVYIHFVAAARLGQF